jgi:hypothetical protein
MVFRNEKGDSVWYNLSDSSKNIDKEYTNKNWNVRFLKGKEPEHFKKINFKGFFTYFKKDENTTYTTIQVMEWEYSEQDNAQYQSNSLDDETLELVKKFKEKNKEEKTDPFFASSNIEVDDSDLPFI